MGDSETCKELPCMEDEEVLITSSTKCVEMSSMGHAELLRSGMGHYTLIYTKARCWVFMLQQTIQAGLANEIRNEREDCKDRRCVSRHSFVESEEDSELFGRLHEACQWGHGSCEDIIYAMDRSSVQVNLDSYASLLRLFGNAMALSVVKRLHHHIIEHGHEKHMYLGNLLVQVYGKCGALESAGACFVQLEQRNVSSWNIMIGMYGRQRQGKVAFQLFEQMQLEVIVPDKITFINLLSICASLADLAKGRQMHLYIIQSWLELDIVVKTALISMYGKCDSLVEAARMFDQMSERNVVSWNAMIAMHAHHKHVKEALRLFEEMQGEGVTPSKVTFISLVDACSSQASLAKGKWVHTCLNCMGFESDTSVANALIHMYSNCGSLQDAQMVFDNMCKKDVISWTTMIAAYGQQDHNRVALQLLSRMHQEGMNPNIVTLISVLDACVSRNGLFEGRKIHIYIIQIGIASNNVVATALIRMYSNCGSLNEAKMVFDNILKWDVISWNSMISAYVEHGYDEEAQLLFDQMQDAGMIPDKHSFVSMLSVYASKADLCKGKSLHAHVTANGFELDIFVATALVNMYGKCASLDDAWRIFSNIHEHNVVAWNALLAAYAQHGYGEEAFQLFEQMEQEKVNPDKITFISLLSVCASEAALAKGKLMHICTAHHKCETDVLVANALVNMYGKCGRLEDAKQMFHKIPEPNVVSWNIMIALCGQHGNGREALELFEKMLQEGTIPNKVTFIGILDACASEATLIEGRSIHAYIKNSGLEADAIVGNALLNMYSKCGSTKDACSIFEKMIKRDVFSWTAMIAAYVLSGHGKDAHQLFDRMLQEGVKPDSFTYVNILSAKASHSSLPECKRIHTQIRHSGYGADIALVTELVNMYSKWGSLEDAQRVFDEIPNRNLVSWNAMIAAYAQHGHGKKALQLFFSMQEGGTIPNNITFVSVLSACSHAGMIEEGHLHFFSMQQHYGVIPSAKHYNCMIDLLGRAGRLGEVEGLMNGMPCQPTIVSWTTLLGACRNQLDVGRGEQAAMYMLELDPEYAAPHIALANIHAKIHAIACQEDDAGIFAALGEGLGLEAAWQQ